MNDQLIQIISTIGTFLFIGILLFFQYRLSKNVSRNDSQSLKLQHGTDYSVFETQGEIVSSMFDSAKKTSAVIAEYIASHLSTSLTAAVVQAAKQNMQDIMDEVAIVVTSVSSVKEILENTFELILAGNEGISKTLTNSVIPLVQQVQTSQPKSQEIQTLALAMNDMQQKITTLAEKHELEQSQGAVIQELSSDVRDNLKELRSSVKDISAKFGVN